MELRVTDEEATVWRRRRRARRSLVRCRWPRRHLLSEQCGKVSIVVADAAGSYTLLTTHPGQAVLNKGTRHVFTDSLRF